MTKASSSILEEILEAAKTAQNTGGQILCVFDLDSTLFDVSPRTQMILNEFITSDEGKALPEELKTALRRVRIQSSDWGLRTALTREGLHTAPVSFQDQVRQFWIRRFFHGDYLQHDRPLAGAVEYLQNLIGAGAQLVYLTGRDLDSMLTATKMVLESHGFPMAPLELKPIKGSDDSLFKVQWFDQHDLDKYPATYFFENEPKNLMAVCEHHPQVKPVFVDSTHSGQAQVSKDWPQLVNFLMD